MCYRDIPYSTSKMDMEKIRERAREQGIDLAVHGLVCLPWNMRKHTGYIARTKKASS